MVWRRVGGRQGRSETLLSPLLGGVTGDARGGDQVRVAAAPASWLHSGWVDTPGQKVEEEQEEGNGDSTDQQSAGQGLI